MKGKKTVADVLFLRPGEGWAYPLRRRNAVLKADHGETESADSVSEWWLEPRTTGRAPILMTEVSRSSMCLRASRASLPVRRGQRRRAAASCVFWPMTHDFENRTDERIGLLNVFPPGGFEENRPAISAWFTGNA